MPEEEIDWRQREALIEISAAIAARDDAGLGRAFRLARSAASAERVDEVILQAHLFVGYPLALEAFRQWREISPTVAEQVDEASGWSERGEQVCLTVYGSAYEKLVHSVEILHPDLSRLMLEVGYGRVIGRPQPDLLTRELCISALLAVWDTPRQLYSHLRGSLNAGATREEVGRALEIACRRLTPEQMSGVFRVWEEVQK